MEQKDIMEYSSIYCSSWAERVALIRKMFISRGEYFHKPKQHDYIPLYW